MLRSVRNDATQRTIWSAPIAEKILALYYDLPVFKDNTKSMLKYKYEQRKKRQNLISVNLL